MMLVNDIIIIIYKYANVDTKYKMLFIWNWLKNIKLKCINHHKLNGYCNKKATYLMHFNVIKIKLR